MPEFVRTHKFWAGIHGLAFSTPDQLNEAIAWRFRETSPGPEYADGRRKEAALKNDKIVKQPNLRTKVEKTWTETGLVKGGQ